MATFLDVGFLGYFGVIFVFLLIFFISYGILKFTKVLGENEGVYAIISLALAFLFVVVREARLVIIEAAPWFVLMFIFVFFIVVAIGFMGIGGGDIGKALSKTPYTRTIVYWIISIGILIMLYSFSQVVGQDVGPYLSNGSEDQGASSSGSTNVASGTADKIRGDSGVGTGDFNTNLGATIFHPKVLGLIVILLIASFAIRLLAGKPK